MDSEQPQPSARVGLGRRRLSVLQTVGSLWFAAVLLVLLLVAMACATVFESMHGSERALRTFYDAWWFKLLLCLLAMNVLAAMLVRFPLSKRQTGFVITHVAILVTLAGALITETWATEGQVSILEGQTVDHFPNLEQETLTITNPQERTGASIDLDSGVFGGFVAVDGPEAPVLSLGNLNVEVLRYLPDSTLRERAFDIPLEACLERAVPVGETGYTVRVLRYLPHATVAQDGTISNLSDRPVNPFIQAELTGPKGPEERLAFAKFPDFRSMHGARRAEEIKLTFIADVDDDPGAPIEVLAGPAGGMYVRFTRLERGVEPVEPVRQTRIPAILLRLDAPGQADEMWVQKHHAYAVEVDGIPCELRYGVEEIPFGFDLTLDRFRLGRYPGEMMPRSFESHVTIVDPVTGREQSHVISMNHPIKHAGDSLFQSRYQEQGGRNLSVLSVASDPGQPVAYLGYIGMIAGMVVVLITRMSERRRRGGL